LEPTYSDIDLAPGHTYWHKRFKEAVSRDCGKIETARKAANEWLQRQEHPTP